MAVPDMWIKLLKVGFGFFFVFVVIRLVSYCRGCIFGLRITQTLIKIENIFSGPGWFE